MNLLAFKAIATAIAAGNMLTGGLATGTFASTPAITPPSTPATEEISTPLDVWIDNLAQLESNGEEHIRILDVNGRYSYGCLQFQLDTFARFGTKYNLVSDGSIDHFRDLIYSCDLQKKIAKAMIQESRSNWRHWFTSVRIKKLGAPPIEVELAKS